MTNETIKSIRKAINAVAKHLELSDYKRLQIQNAEIADPAGWGGYPDCDNSEDASTQRYYDTVESIYSTGKGFGVHTNLVINFRERMLRRYGIYA